MRQIVKCLMAPCLGLALCAVPVTFAGAEGLQFGTKNRAGLFRSQTSVLDSRARTQYANSVRLQPRKFEAPTNYAPRFTP